MCFQDKVNMVLAKGAALEACNWNNTDLKVTIQWFKQEGLKVRPKNKYGLLLCYRETCTCLVPPLTYHEQDEEVATHVATADVGIGVPTAHTGVASTDVGSPTDSDSVASTAIGSPNDRAAVASAAVCSPNDVLWSLGTDAGKPIFAAAAAGIPDAAHASTIAQDQLTVSNALHCDVATTVAATDLHQSTIAIITIPVVAAGRTATCAFPIEDNGWGDLAPLGPRTLRDAAATGEAHHHVNHCDL
jgi:hypothetical protein